MWTKWLWLKAVIVVVGFGAVVAFSQLLLYLDKLGANKFDL